MPFAYYRSLSRKDKAIYDASDRIASVALPRAEALHPIVGILREALERDDRALVEAASRRLVLGITELLGVEPVSVGVLAVRPELRAAELHGLYTRDGARRPRIRVWMRTLRHKRVVAFRTFLRTLLHEVCHHLDYTLLALGDSFHTQGFFSRESSLFKQLVPESLLALDRARSRSHSLKARRGGAMATTRARGAAPRIDRRWRLIARFNSALRGHPCARGPDARRSRCFRGNRAVPERRSLSMAAQK